MDTSPDFSRPPAAVPTYLKYLLGLPGDASRDELETEWNSQVVPLLNSGPAHLFDKESSLLMAGGVTGPTARRLFKGTKRGAKLADAAEREGRLRARQAQSKPPFVMKT